MRLLRFFLLIFGLMMLMTGVAFAHARSEPPVGLWKIVFTRYTGYGWNYVEILPIGRTIDRPTTMTGELSWSPDNEWVVYATASRQTIELTLARPDGSDRRKLKDIITNFQNVLWSPDGQWVYYIEEIFPREYSLIRVRVTDGYVESFELGSITALTCCSWSADGEWLLFWQAQSDSQHSLIRLRPDTSERQIVFSSSGPIPTTFQDGFYFSYPAYFERADWIYSLEKDIFEDQIYRMRPDGTDRQAIHTVDVGSGTLWLSSDGEWIAFISNDLVEGQKLERIRIDGTGRETLLEWPRHRFGSITAAHLSDIWSPDSQELLFLIMTYQNGNENYQLHQLSIQTGEYRRIYSYDQKYPFKHHFLPVTVREWDGRLWIAVGLSALALGFMFAIRR